MWCKNCNAETELSKCPVCGTDTVEDIPYEVYWCSNCNIPIIKSANDNASNTCPICGQEIKYLTTDLRPVFPEERLLFEVLMGKPLSYQNSSVWASDNRYYIDGVPVVCTSTIYKKHSPDFIRSELEKYSDQNTYGFFNEYIKRFIKGNIHRLNYLKVFQTEEKPSLEFVKRPTTFLFPTNYKLIEKYTQDLDRNQTTTLLPIKLD